MGMYQAKLEDDAREFLADISGGDARAALNAIELAILTTPVSPDGKIISIWIQRRNASRSGRCIMIKTGISIMIPSPPLSRACGVRTLTRRCIIWPKCFLPGEDIKFIARRMMICASEDVGNADSAGAGGGCGRRPGSGTDRDAGGPDHTVPGSNLYCQRAKKQCGL